MKLTRAIDVVNLVRELAENKVDSLEIVREALSNAKDHLAGRLWIQTIKDPRNAVTVTLVDDGEGMDQERLAAFWGIGASSKARSGIGYKGHGTKLFFASRALTVATRSRGADRWTMSSLDEPNASAALEVEVEDLPTGHPLDKLRRDLGLTDSGTLISIEAVSFGDTAALLSRRRIESYCDWFTVIGDVRSGLFDTRHAFHRALQRGGQELDPLRVHETEVRPLTVLLRINGEKDFFALGVGPTNQDREFLTAWRDDLAEFTRRPDLLAFGHRFADQHESTAGATRVRDDLSALRLTGPDNWSDEAGFSIVARVEGHRRQRETYREASWSGRSGLYSFESRFGLWLCRDFIPIAQRNDWLRQALERSSKVRLRFELSSLRNWQVFLNSQEFLPTANRGGISNQVELEPRAIGALVRVLERALSNEGFRAWVGRLRTASLDRRRDQEVKDMSDRREDIQKWIQTGSAGAVDPMAVDRLEPLPHETSLAMRAPESEQELFYLYGLLSGRYEMPVHVLEYDTKQGVDAIGLCRNREIVPQGTRHVRIEFKHEISANNPINHFFDAIDLVICWKVDRIGDIYEESSAGDFVGKLRKRVVSVLKPAMDTHEIVYQPAKGAERVIPVLQVRALFPDAGKRPKARSR